MIRPVDSTTKPAKKVFRTIGATAVTAAVATGAVLYLAKTGKLNQTSHDTMFTSALKGHVKSYAKWVENSVNTVRAGFTSVVARIRTAAINAKEGFLDKSEHALKFNPDCASKADLTEKIFKN